MITVEIAATRESRCKEAKLWHPSVGTVRVANVVGDTPDGPWRFQPLPPWRDHLSVDQQRALGHLTYGGWDTLEQMRSGAAAAVGLVLGWWLCGQLPQDALGHMRSYLIGGLVPTALACPHNEHRPWCATCTAGDALAGVDTDARAQR